MCCAGKWFIIGEMVVMFHITPISAQVVMPLLFKTSAISSSTFLQTNIAMLQERLWYGAMILHKVFSNIAILAQRHPHKTVFTALGFVAIGVGIATYCFLNSVQRNVEARVESALHNSQDRVRQEVQKSGLLPILPSLIQALSQWELVQRFTPIAQNIINQVTYGIDEARRGSGRIKIAITLSTTALFWVVAACNLYPCGIGWYRMFWPQPAVIGTVC